MIEAYKVGLGAAVAVAAAAIVFFVWVGEPIGAHADLGKCPFCYGRDFCAQLDDLRLSFSSFGASVNNLLGAKNVLFTKNGVVLKKLASDAEIAAVDDEICATNGLGAGCDLRLIDDTLADYRSAIGQLLIRGVPNFKACPTPRLFLQQLETLNANDDADFHRRMWFLLKINVEPIILQLMMGTDKWAVPKYLGACGRLVAVADAGIPLNEFKDRHWLERASLARQLLQAAKDFTESHDHFRFYLTDASPDNIAVDENLVPRFIDLENLIVVSKDNDGAPHNSEVYDFEGFAYSEEAVCGSNISDHNYYAVCRLLLSEAADWPMMEGGLLHGIPVEIAAAHPELERMLSLCVRPEGGALTRFEIVDDLIGLLREVTAFHQ